MRCSVDLLQRERASEQGRRSCAWHHTTVTTSHLNPAQFTFQLSLSQILHEKSSVPQLIRSLSSSYRPPIRPPAPPDAGQWLLGQLVFTYWDVSGWISPPPGASLTRSLRRIPQHATVGTCSDIIGCVPTFQLILGWLEAGRATRGSSRAFPSRWLGLCLQTANPDLRPPHLIATVEHSTIYQQQSM